MVRITPARKSKPFVGIQKKIVFFSIIKRTMAAFRGFPDLPKANEIALCKINENYCCANADYGNVSTFTNTTKNHPKINVTRDIHHHKSNDGYTPLWNPTVGDNIWKKISSIWYSQGFIEALTVTADPNINWESPFLALVASYALKVTNTFTRFRYFLQPHLKDIGPKVIAKYTRTRNWGAAPVKCLAWHPHTTKVAVATSDDNIRIYYNETFAPTLKFKAQRNVSSLCWRPYSASEIAVGCEQGVIVWTVDPNSTFMHPSSSNAVILRRPNHLPVTDVSWSPNGDLLVSCSAADMSMYVWELSTDSAAPMSRVSGGGTVFARWSLDASKVFAASSSVIFRIWETQRWTPERWCARGGRVVAACWGPDDVLLFAAEGQPTVYSLCNTELRKGAKSCKAQPVLDVTKVQLESGENVGGPILDMVWDHTGRYLALLFEESPLVAIFCTTNLMMQMKISPCCFVVGIDDEIPNTMAFQKNFTDGACLSIAWSSGRVQHFPIVYTETF